MAVMAAKSFVVAVLICMTCYGFQILKTEGKRYGLMQNKLIFQILKFKYMYLFAASLTIEDSSRKLNSV